MTEILATPTISSVLPESISTASTQARLLDASTFTLAPAAGRPSLTQVEYRALHSGISLADGHASHALHPALQPIVANLGAIWQTMPDHRLPDIEAEFCSTYGVAAGSPRLSQHPYARICPTASGSIDIAAAYFKATSKRVAMSHPTFDNLALLMRRRGVPIVPLTDELYASLHEGRFAEFLAKLGVDALCIVNPNNPTGHTLGADELGTIAAECARHGVVLMLDSTFRFYRRKVFDDYQVLHDAGVTFIAIEDTGKTWNSWDMKASLLAFSGDIATEMNELYEEPYLSSSGFTLRVMTALIRKTTEVGFSPALWELVDHRRSTLRAALAGSSLQVDPAAIDSKLSVDWLRCQDARLCDLDLVEFFNKHGVTVLPGRFFFWDSPHDPSNQRNVRISMMRPDADFQEGIARMQQALTVLGRGRP